MKLEVGMYVRTKTGIKQIYSIDNNKTKYKYLYKLKKQDGDGCIDCGALCVEDIIGEPSFEIIDLVQVGDYVNGNKILFKRYKEYPNPQLNHYCLETSGYEIYTKENNIKTIVTKEQFEAMAYKVVE